MAPSVKKLAQEVLEHYKTVESLNELLRDRSSAIHHTLYCNPLIEEYYRENYMQKAQHTSTSTNEYTRLVMHVYTLLERAYMRIQSRISMGVPGNNNGLVGHERVMCDLEDEPKGMPDSKFREMYRVDKNVFNWLVAWITRYTGVKTVGRKVWLSAEEKVAYFLWTVGDHSIESILQYFGRSHVAVGNAVRHVMRELVRNQHKVIKYPKGFYHHGAQLGPGRDHIHLIMGGLSVGSRSQLQVDPTSGEACQGTGPSIVFVMGLDHKIADVFTSLGTINDAFIASQDRLSANVPSGKVVLCGSAYEARPFLLPPFEEKVPDLKTVEKFPRWPNVQRQHELNREHAAMREPITKLVRFIEHHFPHMISPNSGNKGTTHYLGAIPVLYSLLQLYDSQTGSSVSDLDFEDVGIDWEQLIALVDPAEPMEPMESVDPMELIEPREPVTPGQPLARESHFYKLPGYHAQDRDPGLNPAINPGQYLSRQL